MGSTRQEHSRQAKAEGLDRALNLLELGTNNYFSGGGSSSGDIEGNLSGNASAFQANFRLFVD